MTLPSTREIVRLLRRGDSEGFNAATSGASTSFDRVSDTVKDILDGKLTTHTLEHKQEDRWYRSSLIADLQGHIPDVMARAELEVQNEALVANERAAKEASELKSRFVANISHELMTPVTGTIGRRPT